MKFKKWLSVILSLLIVATSVAVLSACKDTDKPDTEIPYNAFYDATKWEYMTNSNGASLDSGEVPVSLADGSIRFFRANQAYNLGDKSNDTISFLLKATHNWSIWLNSSSKDNTSNNSYRLERLNDELRLVVSASANLAAAVITSDYESGEWNQFDVAFETKDGVTRIAISVNGKTASLKAGAYTAGVTIEDNALYHTMPSNFETGGWFAVKVWYANDYVQLKPVELADIADVLSIAVIGDSITEGSGSNNSYIESYPAQMQGMLGGEYNVVNFGLSGRTARTDLPASGTPTGWLDNLQWQGVKAFVPDIAIVKLGTNDSKTSNKPATTAQNFRKAFERIIDELLIVNPDMEIYICTSAYAYSSGWDISNENIAKIIVPVQKAVAEERGLPLIDMYAITQNKRALFPDGIHPNAHGYTMFAEVMTKVIQEGVEGLTEEFLADIDARYNDSAL